MKTFTIELDDKVVEAIEQYVRDIKAQSARSLNDNKQGYTVEQAIAGALKEHFTPFRLNRDGLA